MRRALCRLGALAACAGLVAAAPPAPLRAQNEALLHRLQQGHGLDDAAVQRVRTIFERSGVIGQGNPAISRHPWSPGQCRAARGPARAAGPARPPSGAAPADSADRADRKEHTDRADDEARDARLCGVPHMAPLYDPAWQRPAEARACIDRYEFPGLPCEYPVVWVKAREAALICAAIGKRLCDAHEWEGACQGALQPPDYRFDLARGVPPAVAVGRMREAHNRAQAPDKRWSYGPAYQRGVCATGSAKSPGCVGGGWQACGSNTYPAGAFAACRSPLGVYDLHGNAAEHMNLPLAPGQMASAGSTELGVTEMKGSWFVFDTFRAHEDWCRWRAPYWHGSRVLDPRSHANYHLGFRCCKTLPPR